MSMSAVVANGNAEVVGAGLAAGTPTVRKPRLAPLTRRSSAMPASGSTNFLLGQKLHRPQRDHGDNSAIANSSLAGSTVLDPRVANLGAVV